MFFRTSALSSQSQSHASRAATSLSVAVPFVAPTVYVSRYSSAAAFTASSSVFSAIFSTFAFSLSLIVFWASNIPYPNSALSSNRELLHAGPFPSGVTVYGVDGEELPQIEEHPVAFAMYILSPNNCVTSFAYGVSPHPAHAPENSRSGCLNWLPFTVVSLNLATTSGFTGISVPKSKYFCSPAFSSMLAIVRAFSTSPVSLFFLPGQTFTQDPHPVQS